MHDCPLEQNSYPLQKYSDAKFKVISASLGLNDVIAFVKQDQISCLLIESQQKLIGILTERDLVKLIFSKKDLSFLNVGQVMTRNPIVLNAETNLSSAKIASLFQRYSICYLPLVNSVGRGVGVITPSSILGNLNYQEIDNVKFLGDDRDQATRKIVEQTQNKQLDYLQLKTQNQKLEAKNKLLQQQLQKRHHLKQIDLNDHIHYREKQEKISSEWKFLKTILEQIPGGVIIAEAASGKYVFINKNLAKIFRRKTTQLKKLEDYHFFGFLEDDHSLSPLENCPLVKALANNPVQSEEMRSLCGDKEIRTIFVNSIPICNSQGTVLAAIATFYDIGNTKQDRLAKHEAEYKSFCLKEISHQIKNNLQVISALLDLQSEQVKDKAAYLLLEKSQARIQTMALMYEQLKSSSTIGKIDFGDYVTALTQYLYDSFIEDFKQIELILNIEPIEIGIDLATPCGLIINELVTNSLQHGFTNQDRGKIEIDFFLDQNNFYNVQIKDNGSGINPKMSIKNNLEFLGLSIVESLITEQLKGTWNIVSKNGCLIHITFPKKKESVM